MDSFPNLAVDGYIAWLVIALPVCVLLGLAARLLFGPPQRSVASHGTSASDPVSLVGGAGQDERVAENSGGVSGEVVSDKAATDGAHRDETNGHQTGLVKFPKNKGSESALLGLDAARVSDVRERIRALEAETDSHDELGRLYLELGDFLLAQEPKGREGVALVMKGIAVAIKIQDPLMHGQGRMVMAAQAVEAGDLAGACEHWQLARELFLTAGHKTSSADIGAHMHRCGCPSDWVLTEF